MNEQEDQALKADIRSLPELDPPPDLWARVMAASATRQRRTSRRPLALAACLVAAVALSALVIERSEREAATSDTGFSAQTSVAELIAESQRLEERLRSLPLQGRYGNTGRALAYRIADVDGSLNSLHSQDIGDGAEQRARLLQQRVVLLQSLVEVESQDRGAALRRVAF